MHEPNEFVSLQISIGAGIDKDRVILNFIAKTWGKHMHQNFPRKQVDAQIVDCEDVIAGVPPWRKSNITNGQSIIPLIWRRLTSENGSFRNSNYHSLGSNLARIKRASNPVFHLQIPFSVPLCSNNGPSRAQRDMRCKINVGIYH